MGSPSESGAGSAISCKIPDQIVSLCFPTLEHHGAPFCHEVSSFCRSLIVVHVVSLDPLNRNSLTLNLNGSLHPLGAEEVLQHQAIEGTSRQFRPRELL